MINNISIKFKNRKITLPKHLSSKFKAYREVRSGKKRTKKVIIGTVVDEKILCIPITSESDVDNFVSSIYSNGVDVTVSDSVTYGSMNEGLFKYGKNIYMKSKCGKGFTSININTNRKFKDEIDDVEINDVKVEPISLSII